MSDVEKGKRAIQAMLDMIGEHGATDHAMAKVFCDAEMEIRAALSALGGWNEAIEAAAKAAENFKRPIPPKPTIAELERILQRADPPSVEITPDGEVRAKGTHIGHEIAASIRVLSRPSSSYANRWQPIETAPKDCDVLLGAFYDSGYWDVQLGHWQPHNKRWPPTGQNQPSHWHHIPTPPAKWE